MSLNIVYLGSSESRICDPISNEELSNILVTLLPSSSLQGCFVCSTRDLWGAYITPCPAWLASNAGVLLQGAQISSIGCLQFSKGREEETCQSLRTCFLLLNEGRRRV